MSNIAVTASATGTGTVTLLAPNTNSTQTLTLPDATGTVLSTATPGVPIGGPAFSAYQSSTQTLSSNTITKIQFQTKEYDTNSAFDNATNYRFTPLVAGYYVVDCALQVASSFTIGSIYVYKNGSAYKAGMATGGVAGTTGTFAMACQVFLNGSTDYVECYGIISTGQALVGGGTGTYFQAAMLRSAI